MMKMSSLAVATIVMGAAVGVAWSQMDLPQPPPNCTCGPVIGCNGVTITSTATCTGSQLCACRVLRSASGCVLAISATCVTPPPPKPKPGNGLGVFGDPREA